jgi:hypothetical protein
MLEIMFARLKDEEKMELDNEDKVFIKELSRCGKILIINKLNLCQEV